MSNGEPGDEGLRFIFENIDTVPHLEALLLVWQNSADAWSAETLAARLYVSPAQARGILEDLRRGGFVTQESEIQRSATPPNGIRQAVPDATDSPKHIGAI